MKLLLLLISLFLTLNSFAQEHYAIEFIDKSSDRIEHFIQYPEEMLSTRAIERRERLNISFDAIDIPIDNTQIIKCKETGAEILSTSKWLNTIFVIATDDQKSQLEDLPFIKNIRSLEDNGSSKRRQSSPVNFSKKESNYGDSEVFVTQIRTDFLHNKGFSGNKIQIAVLDAGFEGVNTKAPFKELRDRNGIIGTYNFVERNKNVYQSSDHGTMVLGTMAVNNPDIYIGTAYNAKYWLFSTEDVYSETPKEEFNWIEAIEFADSVGVDVVNSSLGYYGFDSPFTSYTYDDMDGKTTFISRAANIGGQKGIIVVISAGNEGDDPWHYIGAPADAENIISVGAVNSTGDIAAFSSYGPSADGRVKPDVSAMGASVRVYTGSGGLSTKSGTSFSSPILAGSVACLRQAFPKASVNMIIDAMRQSADNYTTPDDRTGYGIANLELAHNILYDQLNLNEFDINQLIISPNPVVDNIYINGINSKDYNFKIYDVLGRLVKKGNGNFVDGVNIYDLKVGLYQLTISEKSTFTLSFYKNK